MTRSVKSFRDKSGRTWSRPVNIFQQIDMFFLGKDPVHQTMRRLARRLERAKIAYAVVGGMAVFVQGYERTTDDVDFLVTSAGFEEFQRLFVPKRYENLPGMKRRFRDKVNGQTLDFLITAGFPGSGKPGPIAYPDPEEVRELIKSVYVVDLATLVQMKLAARRFQDFADVVNLIAAHNLDVSFTAKLHPSLHRDYVECLEEKRREEEYRAREG